MNQLSSNLNKSSAPCESPPSPKTTVGANLDISRELAKTVSSIERKVVEMQLDSKSRGDNDGKHRAVSNKSPVVLTEK